MIGSPDVNVRRVEPGAGDNSRARSAHESASGPPRPARPGEGTALVPLAALKAPRPQPSACAPAPAHAGTSPGDLPRRRSAAPGAPVATNPNPLAHHHAGRSTRSRSGLPRAGERLEYEPDEPPLEWQLPLVVELPRLAVADIQPTSEAVGRKRRDDHESGAFTKDPPAMPGTARDPGPPATAHRQGGPGAGAQARLALQAARRTARARRIARGLFWAALLVAALLTLPEQPPFESSWSSIWRLLFREIAG